MGMPTPTAISGQPVGGTDDDSCESRLVIHVWCVDHLCELEEGHEEEKHQASGYAQLDGGEYVIQWEDR